MNDEARTEGNSCWFCGSERSADSAGLTCRLERAIGATDNVEVAQAVIPRCASCATAHKRHLLLVYFPIVVAMVIPGLFLVGLWFFAVVSFELDSKLAQLLAFVLAIGGYVTWQTASLFWVSSVGKYILRGRKNADDASSHPEVLKLLRDGWRL